MDFRIKRHSIGFGCWALALCCGCFPAVAQESRYVVTVRPLARGEGYQKVSVSAATLGAAPIIVWHNTSIDPDCTARAPGSTLTVLTQPAHGTVIVDDTPDYFAFPPANPRAACNTRKVPGHHATYTATSGFTGKDRFVLEGSTGQGVVRRVTVTVDVRPTG